MALTVDWKALNPLQLGRYAEYYTRMAFAAQGFEVFSSEVDDRGVDFVVRRNNGPFFEIQVKSLRESGYVFMRKDTMPIAPERLVAFLLFTEDRAIELFLIPALEWCTPNALLASNDYGAGKKSAPEWGIRVSRKNHALLQRYRFEEVCESVTTGSTAWALEPIVGAERLHQLTDCFHRLITHRSAQGLGTVDVPLPSLQYCPLSDAMAAWHPIPGMYGGFRYWLDLTLHEPTLLVESWSRVVQGSGQRHHVTATSCELVAEGFV